MSGSGLESHGLIGSWGVVLSVRVSDYESLSLQVPDASTVLLPVRT